MFKSSDGKQVLKRYGEFHSIRSFTVGKSIKQQDQLGWLFILWGEDRVLSLSAPLLTCCISPWKSNELPNKEKDGSKRKGWTLPFKNAYTCGNKTRLNFLQNQTVRRTPWLSHFKPKEHFSQNWSGGIWRAPEELGCPTEVLLMAHGGGYWEDRGYHYLLSTEEVWSKRQGSRWQCSRVRQ